uniref:GH29D-like beta-sandwich domain-containing protein n=2 Tax=Clytia hemisphaerica TaxID=252671 RepID=A0A7M5XG39_9CNID
MKGHTILITEKRFKPEKITLYEGEAITFQLEDVTSEIGHHEVYQVYRDRDSCLRVDGGFASEQPIVSKGTWSQELNLARKYLFKCGDLPLLEVVVNRKPVHVVKVTDGGFNGAVVRLFKGDTVRWTWKNCEEKHNIIERRYCLEHGGYQDYDSRQEAQYSGTYFQTFNVPGIYFFKTQSRNEERAFCVVQVVEKFREHLLDVRDIGFTHALFEINTGDRVWVHWRQSQTNSTTSHSILIKRVCQLGDSNTEKLVIAEDSYPARPAGLFSHLFNDAGIYEILDGERPHLKCVIIVKPIAKQHVVKITNNEFSPALGSVTQGDRIWWTWNGNDLSDDFRLLQVVNEPTSPKGCCQSPEKMFHKILRTVGVFSATLNDFGLETFTSSTLREGNEKQLYCCLVAQPSSTHHEVKLKKNGFFPQSVQAKKGDIVWWKWTGTTNELSGLEQINVSGEHEDSVFDCPIQENTGAYVMRFDQTGTFNFRSIGALGEPHFMAVIVEEKEQVLKVQVSPKGVRPDPVVARTGDIICWMWPKHILSSISEAGLAIKDDDDVFFSNRRCHSQQFLTPGVYHYTCVSLTPHDRNSEFAPDDVWSTVLVDTAITDTIVKNVDPAFYRLDHIHIVKDSDILFTYNKPSVDVWQWSVVCLDDSSLVDIENLFIPNTGRVFSFKQVGTFQVNVVNAKSGKYECVVNVASTEQEAPTPTLVATSKNGGNVREGHTIFLDDQSTDKNVEMYYTTDGSNPIIGEPSTKLYAPQSGIKLNKTGLSFIRAIAKMKGMLPSKPLTSKRFCVMPPDYASTTDVSGDEAPKTKEHLALQKAKEAAVDIEKQRYRLSTVEEVNDSREERSRASNRDGEQPSRPSTVERVQLQKSRASTAERGRPSTIENKTPIYSKVSKPSTAESKPPTRGKNESPVKSRPSTVEGRPKSRPSTMESDIPYVIIKDGTMEKRGKIVSITGTKFVPEYLTLYAGESLTFQLQPDGESLIENKVEQVFVSGQNSYPVTGGFDSGDKIQTTQKWTQEFNCANEYSFSFADHPIFRVVVKPKPVVDAVVTDNGFTKSLIRVYKGDNIRWTWSNCITQHSIERVEYCLKHAGYVPVYTTEKTINNPSKTGSHIETFTEPGVFYYHTQKTNSNGETELDTCVVQVLKKKQEILIELKENFAQRFYECQAGERVWIQWRSSLKTPTVHSTAIKKINILKTIGQTEQTVVSTNDNESTPSGVMSLMFQEAGVYEVFDEEHPVARCVVLVKPTKQQHEVRITKAAFLPALGSVNHGDRIWFTWRENDLQQSFTLSKVQENILDEEQGQSNNSSTQCCQQNSNFLKTVTKAGVYSCVMSNFGVETFKSSLTENEEPLLWCCIISQPVAKHHEIKLKDGEFVPDAIHISRSDFLWFKWSSTKDVHSIKELRISKDAVQKLSLQCPIQPGFGACVNQFNQPGTYVIKGVGSEDQVLLTVIVGNEVNLRKLQVKKKRVIDDPVVCTNKDIVCWMWPKGVASSIDVFHEEKEESEDVENTLFSSRRCYGQTFNKQGVHHFNCSSFVTNVSERGDYPLGGIWSSVLVDNLEEKHILPLLQIKSKKATLNINKGQDILFAYSTSREDSWTWTVTSNGQVLNFPNIFLPHAGRLFYFSNTGVYHVNIKSKNSSFESTINVVESGKQTQAPSIAPGYMEGGSVELGHVISLSHPSKDVEILYTTDGTQPNVASPNTKAYKFNEGIPLFCGGIQFIRAIAMVHGELPSPIFTSSRYYVLPPTTPEGSPEPNDVTSSIIDDTESILLTNEEDQPPKRHMKQISVEQKLSDEEGVTPLETSDITEVSDVEETKFVTMVTKEMQNGSKDVVVTKSSHPERRAGKEETTVIEKTIILEPKDQSKESENEDKIETKIQTETSVTLIDEEFKTQEGENNMLSEKEDEEMKPNKEEEEVIEPTGDENEVEGASIVSSVEKTTVVVVEEAQAVNVKPNEGNIGEEGTPVLSQKEAEPMDDDQTHEKADTAVKEEEKVADAVDPVVLEGEQIGDQVYQQVPTSSDEVIAEEKETTVLEDSKSVIEGEQTEGKPELENVVGIVAPVVKQENIIVDQQLKDSAPIVDEEVHIAQKVAETESTPAEDNTQVTEWQKKRFDLTPKRQQFMKEDEQRLQEDEIKQEQVVLWQLHRDELSPRRSVFFKEEQEKVSKEVAEKQAADAEKQTIDNEKEEVFRNEQEKEDGNLVEKKAANVEEKEKEPESAVRISEEPKTVNVEKTNDKVVDQFSNEPDKAVHQKIVEIETANDQKNDEVPSKAGAASDHVDGESKLNPKNKEVTPVNENPVETIQSTNDSENTA